MDDHIETMIESLNSGDYKALRNHLDELKGSFACLYLLRAMEDDRCDCPNNYLQLIEKLDELLIDRRPKIF